MHQVQVQVNSSSCNLLQKDLDTLVKWSKTWGMMFNIKKCNIISITNATKTRSTTSTPWITSLSTPLTHVCLGVTVNSRLRWNQHIDQISAAANRMLGFLRCTLYRCPQHLKEKTYKAIVRPKLSGTHISKNMEMTQRRAAWFVKNIPFRCSKPPVSVSAMVSDLGWEPLQTRRLHNRLTMMYKITNRLVENSQEYHPAPCLQNTTRGHTMQFQRFQHAIDAFKYAFLSRTIPTWNALPQLDDEADSLDTYK